MFKARVALVGAELEFYFAKQRRPSLGFLGSKEGRTSAGEINAANGMCSPANRR
jgi:hypothetical protein